MSAFVERVESRLRRFGPLVAAVLSLGVVWLVWDIRDSAAIEHDQASYLLQAEIFASGRWTAPSPPIPAFFEEPHVQVVPAVASKYPPGHALLLALGTLVGLPWLVPLLLSAATGALLFALTARVVSIWAAAFAVAFWCTAPLVLRFQGSYFSETTTAVAILGAWWCLLEWRGTRRTPWLLAVAFAIGWAAITRPLTALAFAVPLGVVVLRDVAREGRWRALAAALAVGIAVLGIIPVWSWRTTGSWRETPLIKYQRDYLPYDRPSFSADSTRPRRYDSFDPVTRAMYEHHLQMKTEQPPEAVPLVASQRALNIIIGFFQGIRLPLIILAILGLAFGGNALRFAAASGLTVFVAYLPYAHWEKWSLYYLELTPIAAALTAAGLWHALSRRVPAQGAGLVTAGAGALLLAVSVTSIERWRRENRDTNAFYRAFHEQASALPSQPAILFVSYPKARSRWVAVVRNHVNLEKAPVWIVHDLGPRNQELTRLAPHRTVYHFEAKW